jgi:predicted nucleic acid-binding protein
MGQVFFLDTNVILDYLEKRNQDVIDILAQLLHFHSKSRIVVATSIFTIAELIDAEFQIRFIGECINDRMSGDEIISKLNRDRELYRQVAERNKEKVASKVEEFIVKKQIEVLSLPSNEAWDYEQLYKLLYNNLLRTQDALIAATALANNVNYFLSNDNDLVNALGKLLHTVNLRDKEQRETFRDNVLKAI